MYLNKRGIFLIVVVVFASYMAGADLDGFSVHGPIILSASSLWAVLAMAAGNALVLQVGSPQAVQIGAYAALAVLGWYGAASWLSYGATPEVNNLLATLPAMLLGYVTSVRSFTEWRVKFPTFWAAHFCAVVLGVVMWALALVLVRFWIADTRTMVLYLAYLLSGILGAAITGAYFVKDWLWPSKTRLDLLAQIAAIDDRELDIMAAMAKRSAGQGSDEWLNIRQEGQPDGKYRTMGIFGPTDSEMFPPDHWLWSDTGTRPAKVSRPVVKRRTGYASGYGGPPVFIETGKLRDSITVKPKRARRMADYFKPGLFWGRLDKRAATDVSDIPPVGGEDDQT